MTKRKGSEADFDRLLAGVADPVPSEELMARVMADADAVLAERSAGPAQEVARKGWLGAALNGIGGWPAVAGLATATVAGIWIGFAQPGSLGGVADGLLATGSAYDPGDFMPGFDSLLAEG